VESAPRAYRLKASNAAPPISTFPGAIPGQVLTITYERLLEIYFQNPQFGYYFLVLTSQRLLENISRLEGIIAQQKAGPQAAAAGDIA